MKKYFAKYFPVEGEVKEGNVALKPSFKWKRFDDSEVIEPPYFELVGAGEDITNMKPAKLFLCSRDIQVGDKIENGITSIDKVSAIIKDDLPFMAMNGWYKVIGEISPEATWVKEGDEFDEKELGIRRTNMHGRLINDSAYTPFTEYNFKAMQFCIVSIKGTCCHFH